MELKINKQKITVSLISAIIILLTTSPSFMLNGSSMNIFLIALMGVSPILILLYLKSFGKEDVLLILFLLSITFIPLANQPEAMRWSTVIYSWMFSLLFLTYRQLLLEDTFDINTFLKLLKYLIYAYAIVLVIQQICVVVGLPVFLASHYSVTEPWKLNSLAAEPSWSARSIGFLMFAYILTRKLNLKRYYNFKEDFNDDRMIWISFMWSMLTMNSATAFLFIFIVFGLFLKFRNILFILFLMIIATISLTYVDVTSFNRFFKLFTATLTLNPMEMIKADSSGSIRLVPMIVVFDIIGFTTINDWFGHGIDSVQKFINILYPGLPDGFSGGGMFFIWYEYGFISFLLFTIFSLISIMKKFAFNKIVIWLFLVFFYGVNSQIVWMCITILYTLKFFENKYIKIN